MAKLFSHLHSFGFQAAVDIWVNIFHLVHMDKILQISLHLHVNWLTDQMDSADFKYEVKNSVKCNDVTSSLAEAALPTFCHGYFIRSCS